ncbi:MAG: restriction endonuclease [Candidatus Bipolaricaulia bacterium]
MARKGRDLEKLVALLEERLGPQGIEVTSPDYIRGKESKSRREVDVSLRGRVGSASILVIVECRDRQEDEDVTWIEQLAYKAKDVGASKVMAVSSEGFTSGAINRAEANSIELRTLKEVDPDEILLWFGVQEIVGFKHCVDFTHVSILLAAPDDSTVELPPEVLEMFEPPFDIHAKVFRRKKDGSQASLWDIWTSVSRDEVYSDIVPGDPKAKRHVRLVFPNKQDRFQLATTAGVLDIAYVDISAKLWIEVEKHPLTTVCLYRDDTETIVRTAEFKFEAMGRELTLGLHQLPDSGEQFVSIRATDEESINFNLVLVSINEMIRARLIEAARAGQTITYSEIASMLTDSHLDVEPDLDLIERVLMTVSREEHNEGRPLLSAVVVLPESECPGERFFALAQELGAYDGVDDSRFFSQELQRVYEYWQRTEEASIANHLANN